MAFVTKDNDGNVTGIYASPQPGLDGYAEVADDDSALLIYEQALQIAEGTAQALHTYQTILLAGLTVTSNSNPDTSGTFPVAGTFADGSDVAATGIGVYTGIKSGDGLPGGGSTFDWSDIDGHPHPFTEEQFAALFILQRNYRYAVAQAALSPSPVWPAATGTIP